jgi:GTP-binding protein
MFQVAIIGRPNVGKSTLFNRLCGFRKAIVGDEPGITRDRIYGSMEWNNKAISFLDTGGMILETSEDIPARILEQVATAISESQLVLMVVDGRAGIVSLDEQLLPMLRKSGKPFWTIVNKIDAPELEHYEGAFYKFGAEEVFAISAEHGRGTADLLDAIAERVESSRDAPEPEALEEIAVAVVGRPNVGKSSLVNRLLGYERSIVTDVPGTTRDAVDTLVSRDGVRFRIIDTAGIRRKGKTEGLAEKISVVMAQKSLERADVALLLLDAVEGVTKQDAGVGGYAADSGCSVIIVLNKWDLVEKDTHTLETFTENIHRRMKYLSYAPIVSVSARNGQRVSKLFDVIRQAHQARRLRIPTGTLNNMFVPDLEKDFASQDPNQKLGIRYITQARTNPPTFVIFVSGRDRLHFSTERYLVNRLRDQFGFFATPIRIQQRLKAPKTQKIKDSKR